MGRAFVCRLSPLFPVPAGDVGLKRPVGSRPIAVIPSIWHDHEMLILLSMLIALAALPALTVTAAIAIILRWRHISIGPPAVSAALVGTVVPFLMVSYGLYRFWAWPWFPLELKYDGLGQPGAWLVVSAAPVWVACFALSWLVLGRQSRNAR